MMTSPISSLKTKVNSDVSTGILLIAHAPLASAFKTSAVHALPEYEHCIAVYDVTPHTTPDNGLKPCSQLAHNLYGSQLLILTDIIGATPYNLSKKLQDTLTERPDFHKPIELISGVNLPMLLRALTYNKELLDKLVLLVIAGGVKGIAHIPPNDDAPY